MLIHFHTELRQWMAVAVIATAFAGGCCGPMACGPRCHDGIVAIGGAVASASHGGCSSGCEGCGERYIDEWINHPPDCCEPCDDCGNHDGQSCGACRGIFEGIPSLWGYRRDCGCDQTCERAWGPGGGLGGVFGLGRPTTGPSCGGEPSCGCDHCTNVDARFPIERF